MILIEKADDLKSYMKDNFKAIFTILVVIAGLTAGIILANNPEILKSRADSNTISISKGGQTTFNVTNNKNIQVNFNANSFQGSDSNSKSTFTPKY